MISDSKKIASIFNNHFSTIGSKIEQGIPFHPGNFKDYLNKKDKNGKLFVNSTNTSFFLSPTMPREVEKIIDAPDVKKSTGPNSVPIFLLKTFKLFFSVWLIFALRLEFFLKFLN